MRKRKIMPIILFVILAIIGFALFVKFDTPRKFYLNNISDYEAHNSFAPPVEWYLYSKQSIGKTTFGYYSGIILGLLGIIGTVATIFINLLPDNNKSNGYCNILKHVLLLLLTFGIYYLIWIYRTTKYLNQVKGVQQRNPTSKLLLCIFVPFYLIYWIYISAQLIDKLASSKGVESNIVTICSVLAIFINIIPPIIMQDKINIIATAINT